MKLQIMFTEICKKVLWLSYARFAALGEIFRPFNHKEVNIYFRFKCNYCLNNEGGIYGKSSNHM